MLSVISLLTDMIQRVNLEKKADGFSIEEKS